MGRRVVSLALLILTLTFSRTTLLFRHMSKILTLYLRVIVFYEIFVNKKFYIVFFVFYEIFVKIIN